MSGRAIELAGAGERRRSRRPRGVCAVSDVQTKEGERSECKLIAAALLCAVGLLLSGCMTELGPGGSWLHYEFADGFCSKASMMGSTVELGHCADEASDDDPGSTLTAAEGVEVPE